MNTSIISTIENMGNHRKNMHMSRLRVSICGTKTFGTIRTIGSFRVAMRLIMIIFHIAILLSSSLTSSIIIILIKIRRIRFQPGVMTEDGDDDHLDVNLDLLITILIMRMRSEQV